MLPPMRSVPTCYRALAVLFSQCLVLFLLIAVAHASSTSDRRELGVDLIPESLVDLNWNDGPAHALVVEAAVTAVSGRRGHPPLGERAGYGIDLPEGRLAPATRNVGRTSSPSLNSRRTGSAGNPSCEVDGRS